MLALRMKFVEKHDVSPQVIDSLVSQFLVRPNEGDHRDVNAQCLERKEFVQHESLRQPRKTAQYVHHAVMGTAGDRSVILRPP